MGLVEGKQWTKSEEREKNRDTLMLNKIIIWKESSKGNRENEREKEVLEPYRERDINKQNRNEMRAARKKTMELEREELAKRFKYREWKTKHKIWRKRTRSQPNLTSDYFFLSSPETMWKETLPCFWVTVPQQTGLLA